MSAGMISILVVISLFCSLCIYVMYLWYDHLFYTTLYGLRDYIPWVISGVNGELGK